MEISNRNLRVIVVGSGCAGLSITESLVGAGLQVMLVGRHYYEQPPHTLKPGIKPKSDSFHGNIQKLFEKYKNFRFQVASVRRILTDKKMLVTNKSNIKYDFLILEAESCQNSVGLIEINKIGTQIRNLKEAFNLRRLVLQNFEEACRTKDLNEQRRLLSYIIVGGGDQGVGMATILSELKNCISYNDYPQLDVGQITIKLIESGDRLTPQKSVKASEQAYRHLDDRGVDIQLNTKVTGYNGGIVKTDKQKYLSAKTLIWARESDRSFPISISGKLISSSGKVNIDNFNRLRGYQDIFAIGNVSPQSSGLHQNKGETFDSIIRNQVNVILQSIRNLVDQHKMNGGRLENKARLAS